MTTGVNLVWCKYVSKDNVNTDNVCIFFFKSPSVNGWDVLYNILSTDVILQAGENRDDSGPSMEPIRES